MTFVDWSDPDPCEVLMQLRETHHALITGAQVRRLMHNGKTVEYTAASLPALRAEISRLELLCARQTSPFARPGRHAIVAG